MRIISSFQDYYDAVMKTGMDRDVVYVRETSSSDLDKKYKLDRFHSGGGSHHKVDMFFLGYCGQIIRIYVVDVFSSGKHVFFDHAAFQKFMLANRLGSEWDFHRRWWPGTYVRFQDFNANQLLEIFHEKQVPLFAVKSADGRKDPQLILNPNLKNFKFQTVKDPYTAYQDIFQYVSGVLNAPETKMVKITDKDKIHKHGFDKWSFRKLPTKKKLMK